jgi:hypothetical protein
MADAFDPIRALGELPLSHAGRVRFLPEADQSVFGTIQLGVLFVMAFWSGPSRLAFAQLKRALTEADPDGRLEVVVVDTDGCPNLYDSPDWHGGLHGAGETAWICEGRVIFTGRYGSAPSEFESNTRRLLNDYASPRE